MRRRATIEVCSGGTGGSISARIAASQLEAWMACAPQAAQLALQKSGVLPSAIVTPLLPPLPGALTLAHYRSGPPPRLRLEVGGCEAEAVLNAFLASLREDFERPKTRASSSKNPEPVFALEGVAANSELDDGVLSLADLPWLAVGSRLRSRQHGACRILRVEEAATRFVLEAQSGETLLLKGEELICDCVLDLDQRMSRMPVALELSVKVETEAR